jgi:hypothetical protein
MVLLHHWLRVKTLSLVRRTGQRRRLGAASFLKALPLEPLVHVNWWLRCGSLDSTEWLSEWRSPPWRESSESLLSRLPGYRLQLEL